MKERRATERRNFSANPAHMIKGIKGRVFNADRRRIPDRRLNNIRVEFISIDDFYQLNSQKIYHS